ncbi:MAG TPA: bifunctional UDP-N-acetylglucosamine diphosphorylase/glucosamine-1-phosphate N-acetyltransferase GlmU [Solirubrobacterales bacterium]|nr:bifunctional UDP-N-acetylglucosamine diphosphorylase/glucosamine-1-phosphate N-acetyltransferase GlmU [Solirubrobacterales bacterium]
MSAAASNDAPAVLIMAAGEGTRMRSSLPKPLHPVCGRPMVAWPVLAAREAGAGRVAVIVSPNHDLSSALPEGTETFVQPEPNGTGGAVRAALDLVRASGTVVVVNGDHPLVSAAVIRELLEAHRAAGAAATVMSVLRDDAEQLGRIVRGPDGTFERIVETKHPEGVPPEVLEIREVNTNQFAFEGGALADALGRLENDNPAGEYYIGDVLPLIRAAGGEVIAHRTDDLNANLGVNSRLELARAAELAREMILERHMLAGVGVTDPASTWVDAGVELAADVTLEPGTMLRGATSVGAGSVIGPHSTLIDVRAGERTRIPHSYLTECEVGDDAQVGPFAYLRPGTRLATGAKAGTFVEIKNSEIAPGAKVPHLAYIGDTEVGAGTNIGAGAITANYDGFRKNRTKIGERARIGVNNSLVAPVAVGDDAYTGAGAVIRKDVPPGALGVSKVQQRNIEGYAERKAREMSDDSEAPRGERREED